MIESPTAATRLVAVLRDPQLARGSSDAEWLALITTARRRNLLGALAQRLHEAGLASPAPVQRHLDGASQLAARQCQSVIWEAHQLREALGGLGMPFMLLKGAAYVLGEHAAARGRLFGDIDILVPQSELGRVESTLLLDGWVSAKTSAYDQRYYRQWMHELPPMMHMRRGTVLDLHHTILPLTARNAPDPARILGRGRPVAGLPGLLLPAQEDLLIHSLTHLVHEGELDNALRDLYDIDRMVDEFAAMPGFWDRLGDSAAANDLAGPVWLGLALAQRVIDTPVPAALHARLRAAAGDRWCAAGLIRHYLRALELSGAGAASAGWARLRLYVRAHALRMPARLLVQHLAVKAWQRAWDRSPPGNG